MSNASGFLDFIAVENNGGRIPDDPSGYSLPAAAENGNDTVTLAEFDTHADTTEEIVDWTMPAASPAPGWT
ncbi:MAG: hypothetical protein ACLQU1_14830 [Bryobacteraceae bacterium]